MPFLHVPHIRQQSSADCLVACAAMMLAAVHVEADYARLRALLGYKASGIPFRRLTQLTQLHATLRVTVQQGTLQLLRQTVDRGIPPTIFVWTGELPYWSEAVYHALVIVGYTETAFYLHDPAFVMAPQIVSNGDLDLAWLENDTYLAFIERSS